MKYRSIVRSWKSLGKMWGWGYRAKGMGKRGRISPNTRSRFPVTSSNREVSCLWEEVKDRVAKASSKIIRSYLNCNAHRPSIFLSDKTSWDSAIQFACYCLYLKKVLIHTLHSWKIDDQLILNWSLCDRNVCGLIWGVITACVRRKWEYWWNI
jgi:hypothetical protein